MSGQNEQHAGELSTCRSTAIAEARRRGLNAEDAEDVAQEVVIRLLSVLNKGGGIRSVRAWTITATRRLVINLHRDANCPKRGGGLVESLDALADEKDDSCLYK